MSFKPYYKWNTFNTDWFYFDGYGNFGFKPYYNWNTFNTIWEVSEVFEGKKVLNLIITGIPSIHN